MILKKIKIQNYRAYKNFECEFSQGINLVIGDNGVGKTSLLTAITQLLSVQVGRLGGMLSIETNDPHLEVKMTGDATLSIKECFPMSVSGEIEMCDGELHQFSRVWDDYIMVRNGGSTDCISHIIEQDEREWPLINYQRFDREWRIGRNINKTVEVETGLNDRKDGYANCLKGIGQEAAIQKWCLKMAMLEFEQKSTINEFERFKNIIRIFLQAMEDTTEDFEVSYSMGFSGLVMKKGEKIQPLYELSTGYKALLSMIMELAYRSVLLNPGAQIDDTNQEGIVIIDEIDAHLHPKWQWKVMEALKNCFPKVQFIIATHSPIVIASAKDAMIITLDENGEALYSDGAYGYNVADVLDLKQGSSSMSKRALGYITRLENALDKGNLSEADQVILDAKEEFGENSPMYDELKNYYEINRWVDAN